VGTDGYWLPDGSRVTGIVSWSDRSPEVPGCRPICHYWTRTNARFGPASTLSAQHLQERPAHEHRSVEVDSHDSLPQLEVEVVPGRGLEDRRVVDKDVDPAKFVHDAVALGSYRGWVEAGSLMSSRAGSTARPVAATRPVVSLSPRCRQERHRHPFGEADRRWLGQYRERPRSPMQFVRRGPVPSWLSPCHRPFSSIRVERSWDDAVAACWVTAGLSTSSLHSRKLVGVEFSGVRGTALSMPSFLAAAMSVMP
jgi:hypothetical protein